MPPIRCHLSPSSKRPWTRCGSRPGPRASARDLTRFILSARGADVTAVRSAGDALHALGIRHFDALVADIGMPGDDGYALIRAVRALRPEDGALIPAVALTAYATLRDRDDALREGYDWHIAKPAAPNELVAAVASVISARAKDM
jgi:CheY-like chemotaxis protein